MKILYPEIETMSREDIQKYQLKCINDILCRVCDTPYYKNKLPDKISTLSEFSELPFLTKDDLRKAFPFELLSCPKEKLVRINASSGTTGVPTLSYCSGYDLEKYTENEMLHLSHAGLNSKSTIQCMIGFNLFTAGWGCYHGAIGLGASVIPSGPGNTQRQINLLKQLKAEYCFSTPGYLQHLLQSIPDEDWKDISLKVAMTGGEPLSLAFQKLAKEKYNVEVYNFYGMTEFATHIASECHLHSGLHVNEAYLYPEIVDPETGKLLPDGEYGELVLTNLVREGMPLIRYKTHDITRIIPEPCECGRTHRRIEAITHRIDDMLIVNGVNIYPSQIEECIYRHLNFATNYLVRINEKHAIKTITIDIELDNEILNNHDITKKYEQKILKTLKALITVTPKINFIPKNTLPDIYGKQSRIVIENI